jgi:pimeloyl-ACP methyl ester carboxylesterase
MSAAFTRRGLWVDQRGAGPDVLLIAGLGDPAEAWQFQLDGLSDRYRLTAYDNRGMGRSPLPEGELSVASMADDAAAVLDSMEVGAAHIAGFSGGSMIAQELALRHPERVRSLVLVSTWARLGALQRSLLTSLKWMAELAPDPRAFMEAFFVWIYTARAHDSGMVAQIIDEAMDFPHPPSVEAMTRTMDAFAMHDTLDRLGRITVPTLVLAGGQDLITPPSLGRVVAEAIGGARFELWPDEAHQPFQEVPDQFNARVDEFWRLVEAASAAR